MFSTKGGAGTVPFLGSEPLKYLLGMNRASGYGSGSTAAQVAADWDGTGKTVLITGASAGLGLESAKVMAARGADVVLAVRNPVKTEKAMAQIRAAVPGAKLTSMPLDLGSLASVKAFCDAFIRSKRPLHVLMANAGIMALESFEASADGYEAQWATNHLGHHLLVRLLLPVMLDTAAASGVEGRIVILSSYGHSFISRPDAAYKLITKEALTSPKGYVPFNAYGVSKLSNILHARQLNATLLNKQPVVAVACHPGFIMDTDLSRHMLTGVKPEWLRQFLLRTVAIWVGRALGKDIPQGAATQMYAATAPAGRILGGEYYSDCQIELSSVPSHHEKLAQQLWDLSEDICAPYLK